MNVSGTTLMVDGKAGEQEAAEAAWFLDTFVTGADRVLEVGSGRGGMLRAFAAYGVPLIRAITVLRHDVLSRIRHCRMIDFT